MQRVHAIIEGTVQGVFYRACTQERGRMLNLTGYVKNRVDGNVELIAEGARADLQALLDWCHEGPPKANVTRIETTWSEATEEFADFDIRRR